MAIINRIIDQKNMSHHVDDWGTNEARGRRGSASESLSVALLVFILI